MNENTNIELKFLKPNIIQKLPKYSTIGSAGVDLHAAIEKQIQINANECIKVPTGIAISIANNKYAAIILPRSGLGHKGLILGNSIGLIDSDYQGELVVSCLNRSSNMIIIEPLMRFAQLVIIPVIQSSFKVVNEFSTVTQRAEKGFGHTGTK